MATLNRKPLTKAQKAKMQAGLKRWRDSLTDEARAAKSAQAKSRWAAMSKKEQAASLAGVQAWHAEQRAAKADKAKPAPKPGSKTAARKRSRATEVSESPTRARTRKAVAK